MPTLSDNLSLSDFVKIVIHDEPINLDEKIIERAQQSFDFLKQFAEDKVIYGVNTGFGPMAQYRISDEKRNQLQYNLIRSHATGMGNKFNALYAKATLLARLNSLALGKSAIHPQALKLMTAMLNKNIVPVIYEHGGVGASGDLVQLAHLALVLIGESHVVYDQKIKKTADAFAENGLRPLKIHLREGLALMNGTSAMSGVGMVNSLMAKKLLDWSIAASTMITEIVNAYDDHLSIELNAAKKHEGQQKIAQMMREHLHDSTLSRKREHHLYSGHNKENIFKEKVQEYYSIRCVPQILGPVLDTMNSVEKTLLEEINSANDNPIVDVEKQQVYHGGNFHGDYISLEMDKLKLVVTKVSMLAERQLNYLLNPKLNDILPPFVNMGELGLNFGMQGAQFTATSTTAENQALSTSLYVHSIPNNNDNQDIVSMGTNAALMTKKVIDNAFEIMSIEMVTIVQAIDFLAVRDKVSSRSRKIHDDIREIFPTFKEDEPMHEKLAMVKDFLMKIK
ncbi:MAG: histidine ammonia-lyase [Cytophagaceae bacterium]|nr:histidine ammonia-lyase [Cytophagaceae bacterium]|tara:strand:+ start:9294 stop:10817 length:1524 start_codon:yes stop_codon:yes gene_type:complete